jgi:hypothetical protein
MQPCLFRCPACSLVTAVPTELTRPPSPPSFLHLSAKRGAMCGRREGGFTLLVKTHAGCSGVLWNRVKTHAGCSGVLWNRAAPVSTSLLLCREVKGLTAAELDMALMSLCVRARVFGSEQGKAYVTALMLKIHLNNI